MFATETDEVVSENAWRERDAEKSKDVGGAGEGFTREDLMGDKERELEAVRRAVEEARSGTPGRDIGIGGSFNRGSTGSPAGGMSIQMGMDDEARDALGGLQPGGLVQLVGYLFLEHRSRSCSC